MENFDHLIDRIDIDDLPQRNSIEQVDWLEAFEERIMGKYDVGSNLLNNERILKDGNDKNERGL